MEVSDFLILLMLRVVFNIEAGNYYSNTFIVTLIKQENLVFILGILYIREYLCVFTKLFTGTRVSKDFQFPKMTKNAHAALDVS